MKPILEIRGISKKFRIHHQHQSYQSLRDGIASILQNKSNKGNEDFWALKNISFSVGQGESLGIIGKNGAGKSTLLKILSKITPPTSGKIISRGRIASLLEVGTGFHSELSGKENIFLNGAILGMKRREIQRKFDEIVDFAGVENFLDTPLKHYSSGMQLRLAFAVAAFLEPEILIIDEVLAVGDAEFQRKCLGKMEDVSKKEGRTILFVSHNMGAVTSLTQESILLSKGNIIYKGKSKDAINVYLGKELMSMGEIILSEKTDQLASITKITVLDHNNIVTNQLPLYQNYKIKITIHCKENTKHFIVGIGFLALDDNPIRSVWSKPINIQKGVYEFLFKEEAVHLVYGKYKLIFGLSAGEHLNIESIKDVITLEFIEEHNKDIALHTNSGIILNQMEVEISKKQ